MELTDRINHFVKGRNEFNTKGERREKRNRKRMPMHGRNTGQIYRNAALKNMPKQDDNVNKALCPNCYGQVGNGVKCPSCGSRTDKPMSRYGKEFSKPLKIKKDAWTDKINRDLDEVASKIESGKKQPDGPPPATASALKFKNYPPKQEVIMNSLPDRINKFIEKAGAPILPCGQCGRPTPHFVSGTEKTKGLCHECIRIKLTSPKIENKPVQKDFKPYPNQPSVKSNMWNRQKLCINPQCGWKQGYTEGNPKHALIEQSGTCPQCTKVTRDVSFSPDF
jgi:hypothetical protein